MKNTLQKLKGGIRKMKAKSMTFVVLALLVGSLFAFPLALAGFGTSVADQVKVNEEYERTGLIPYEPTNVRESNIPIIPIQPSITPTDIANEMGVDISAEFADFDLGKEDESLVVLISFSGPEIKGFLLEKTAVFDSSDVEIITQKSYSGKFSTPDGEFKLEGKDMSNLAISGVIGREVTGLEAAISKIAPFVDGASKVSGMASFDFEDKTVTLSFNTGNTKTYKLDEIIRRPVREGVSPEAETQEPVNVAPEGRKEPTDVAREVTPFWNGLIPATSAANDVTPSEDADEDYGITAREGTTAKQKISFWKRFLGLFRDR